jgi:hypothetical protein
MTAWLPLGLGLLTLLMRLGAAPWPVDDAYITFRYARNLAHGLGLVYNPGQAVLGTSTPLFALALALLARVTGIDLPWAALALNAVADAVTAMVLYGLARRLGLPEWTAVLCSLTWILYPLGTRYALGGMETPLASVLMLAALALAVSGHPAWAMASAGFALLTRPDAIAVAFVIAVAETFRARRPPWRAMLIPLAIVLPWLIVATTWYGNPLPQSLRAKSGAVYVAAPAENARQILYNVGGLMLAGPARLAAKGLTVYRPSGQRWFPIAVAVALLIVWVIGAMRAVRADRRWAALFALPVLVCGTYAIFGLRGNLIAEWYLVPLAPIFFLGIFAGLESGARRLPSGVSTAAVVVAASILVGAQLSGLGSGGLAGALVPKVVWTEREDLYRDAAERLRPLLKSGDVVAATEIGALGYYCECLILDTVGLVSPEALKYYPLPTSMYSVNYAVPPDLIRDTAPAYVVSLDVFVDRSLISAPWFTQQYHLVEQLDADAFGSTSLLIYRRSTGGRGG